MTNHLNALTIAQKETAMTYYWVGTHYRVSPRKCDRRDAGAGRLTQSAQGPRVSSAPSAASARAVWSASSKHPARKGELADTYAKLGFPFDAIIEVDAVCDTGQGHVVTTEV